MNINAFLRTWAIAAATLTFFSCSDDYDIYQYEDVPDPPLPSGVGEQLELNKPKGIWIDCEANFTTMSTKAGIDRELHKIKNAGFTFIYLDVQPSNGYALYKSDIMPYCNTFGPKTVTRDYDDYLGYVLEKCEELGLDVIASTSTLCFGYKNNGITQGYVYDHWDQWKDKVQVRNDITNPNIVVPITEDDTQSFVPLNPSDPDVQKLLVNVMTELVQRYPKIKGVCFDYLRYNNNDGGWYGLGQYDLEDYARYWNEPVPKRNEIITDAGGIGPKFAKWIEYRSMVITNLVRRLANTIREVNPKCEVHLWASADWGSRYCVGQNWASTRYIPDGIRYTDTYNKTGFADAIDVFVTGAYTEYVWIKEYPSTVWTVENFVKTWDDYIMGDCKCYGSIATYALNALKMADATYLCLRYTDGYANFELSHENNGNLWDATTKGIERYEKLVEQNSKK